jgi:hypothetical protein
MLGAYLNASPTGVRIYTVSEDAPRTTTIKISRNTFTALGDATAIRDTNLTGGVETALWVANNTFDWTAGLPGVGFGILVEKINRGIVSGNVFTGDFSSAVRVGSATHPDNIFGWSVTGNSFDDSIEGSNHVVFDNNVRDSVFGPGQPGKVSGVDYSSKNFMLND